MAINEISGFSALSPVDYSIGKTQKNDENSVSFSEYLKSALNKVDQMQKDSGNVTNAFAAGKTDNIHQVMIAAEKAEVALQFTMQIRNKIMEAYNEIMRMQI